MYRLKLSDASVRTPNMRWTMQSSFGTTQVFVTASVDETTTTYQYGKITTLATGTQNQETIGTADSGTINGNEITIRLDLAKVNAAVGSDVLGTTSTATQAKAQILIGSSLTGGLLLNSDSATGSDFVIEDGDPTPTPTPNPNSGGRFDERYSGTINPGQASVIFAFELRRSLLDAQINQNHGNQQIVFELLDANFNLIATASQHKIRLDGLATGTYYYRVRGNVSKAVDFTIKSGQGS